MRESETQIIRKPTADTGLELNIDKSEHNFREQLVVVALFSVFACPGGHDCAGLGGLGKADPQRSVGSDVILGKKQKCSLFA